MNYDNQSASRLSQLREQLKLSQKEFANKIGITQGALSQLESAKSTLSLLTIAKISRSLNVDCNWLITGTGPVFTPVKDAEKSKKIDDSNIHMQAKLKQLSAHEFIPLISEEAHAGYIKQCQNPDYIDALDVYKIPGFENGNYRMFEIEGDSMTPTILPREIVVTEAVENTVENGTLCVVVTEDGIVAKRVYTYKEEPDALILKSDNPSYKSYSIQRNDASEIWEIKAKITNVLNAESHLSAKRLSSIEADIQQLKEQLSRQ
ncbi:XRE family transcriptional regulator [Ningiella sp. W23]|uniref:XRE family transcriptional regulator n=1 Tax=Ningiella sp. W23 TaxID=3023715 RepID=UPI003757139E